jgi:ribonucleoside-diphosphate reductase alpha chain
MPLETILLVGRQKFDTAAQPLQDFSTMEQNMQVVKRDGRCEDVAFEKVQQRISKAATGLTVNATKVAQGVLARIVDGISTTELDNITANLAYSWTTTHPDYGVLASRIAVSNHQKNTPNTLLEVMEILEAVKDRTGAPAALVDPELVRVVKENSGLIEGYISYERDFNLDFFGFKTLEKAYLLRDTDRKVIERPQHMWMRVALGLWMHDLPQAFVTYDLMSQKYYTHATPTLFNAGTKRPQLSSCFLLAMNDDSIRGIYKTLEDCALISQYGGGIGLHVSNIRAKGSLIRGTGGVSNGIVPMLRVFNNTARYVDQGGGKRNGSFAMYLEPWHADVEDFLEMKKNTGAEEERARDLFYAMWVPDLFMERVDSNGDWTLFCPNEAPGLADVVGDEFKALYTKYEAEGRGRKTIKAQKLWFQILDSQIETGTPYLLYKDAANLKSNQKNLGVIKSSNLCTEIIEYSSPEETAVCNLASMSLPAFVRDGAFDFKQFRDVVQIVIRNLNRVIDINYYPIPEAERSNKRHRPIGLGVQGLADVFAMLGLPWESEEAASLNKRIFAHMYYAACQASVDLASKEGRYETYVGSPMQLGEFQFNLWKTAPLVEDELDWDSLANDARRIGMRNSLLIAPMPTASTSQILGNCECIEPYATHIFTRRTLAGEFIVLNRHLVAALLSRGLWTPELKDAIIGNNGSVQGLPGVPEDIQRVFKTVWEIKQKTLIDMAADRGPYICQSQSLNLFMADPDYKKLSSMHFYAWRKGLKTGIYYLRTRAVASAQKFTVEPVKAVSGKEEPAECVMCSS